MKNRCGGINCKNETKKTPGKIGRGRYCSNKCRLERQKVGYANN